MKIAVDARELANKPTGVGRYLSELLTEWSDQPVTLQHTWTLYSPDLLTVPPAFADSVRVLSRGGGTKWEQWTLAQALRSDRPDVLFAPGYSAPLAHTCPMVLTVHDVSFFAHPEWFTFREGARRRTFTRLSASRARLVVTDSEFSRAEIVRHLGLQPATIRVIPLGVRTRPSDASADNGRPRDPLVLFVGSIFTRRHVDALIESFARYVAPHVAESRLEIVGDNRAYPPMDLQRILRRQPLDIQQRISIRTYVSNETLADLYARASVFVFPSEYEGFGLTPLEALAAGVSPIVLDTPIASEIYGPAAHYVSNTMPLDERLGEAMTQPLTDASARRALLHHRASVLGRYRWSTTARETLAAIEEAGRA